MLKRASGAPNMYPLPVACARTGEAAAATNSALATRCRIRPPLSRTVEALPVQASTVPVVGDVRYGPSRYTNLYIIATDGKRRSLVRPLTAVEPSPGWSLACPPVP